MNKIDSSISMKMECLRKMMNSKFGAWVTAYRFLHFRPGDSGETLHGGSLMAFCLEHF